VLDNSFAEWGLDCGRLFGIRIKIHWSFFIFVLFRVLRAEDMQTEALFLAVLFGTVLIHEFGHCFGARHFGLNPDKILLWPFGGLAYVGSGRSAREDFWITFFGPFVHIPIALAAGSWLYWQGATITFVPHLLSPLVAFGGPHSLFGMVISTIFAVQVWLFSFNVFLPAYPMDGGRMLVALTLNRLGPLKASGLVMMTTLLSAIFLLTQSDSFIGFWLLMEAAMLYQWRQTGQIYNHPSFGHSGRPMYSSQPRSKPKVSKSRQVSHLRLVDSKQCPQCGRSLPTSAKMCGFCEISV